MDRGQNKKEKERERAIKRLKRFTGPGEKGEETVMLIMCVRVDGEGERQGE